MKCIEVTIDLDKHLQQLNLDKCVVVKNTNLSDKKLNGEDIMMLGGKNTDFQSFYYIIESVKNEVSMNILKSEFVKALKNVTVKTNISKEIEFCKTKQIDLGEFGLDGIFLFCEGTIKPFYIDQLKCGIMKDKLIMNKIEFGFNKNAVILSDKSTEEIHELLDLIYNNIKQTYCGDNT